MPVHRSVDFGGNGPHRIVGRVATDFRNAGEIHHPNVTRHHQAQRVQQMRGQRVQIGRAVHREDGLIELPQLLR